MGACVCEKRDGIEDDMRRGRGAIDCECECSVYIGFLFGARMERLFSVNLAEERLVWRELSN